MQKDSIAIRDGVQADAEVVFAIRANARRQTYKDFLSPKAWRSFEIQNAASDENLAKWGQKVAEYLADKATYIFRVAVIDAEVVGWSLSDIRRDQVHLMRLFVSTDHQGQGIGSRLLKDLYTFAGDKKITLTVLKPNVQALNVYKKNGFIELEPACYSYLGVGCVKMEKPAPHLDTSKH